MADETREQTIEKRLDPETSRGLALASGSGGSMTIAPRNMGEMMEFAKLMAISGPCVRPAFRGSPGACLAIALQAFKWGADPFAVANKAYVTKNRGNEEQIGYEAQLVHAIVNTSAVLQRRLRPTYAGNGGTRKCLITGFLKGEDDAFEYESPEVGKIAVKNSPQWTSDPDQQLFYYSVRAWARRHVPEILLGIYTPEEIRGAVIDMESPMAGDMPHDPIPLQTAGPAEKPEPESFSVVTAEGEVMTYALQESAERALEAIMKDALRQGRQALEAVLENNPGYPHLRDMVPDEHPSAHDAPETAGEVAVSPASPADPKRRGPAADPGIQITGQGEVDVEDMGYLHPEMARQAGGDPAPESREEVMPHQSVEGRRPVHNAAAPAKAGAALPAGVSLFDRVDTRLRECRSVGKKEWQTAWLGLSEEEKDLVRMFRAEYESGARI